ncbi:MAG: relaxase domain-containing protein [Rhodospirillales bacterium]|nr:relaxase domain-containing protein [Rhodospirillales bacterium]MDE0377884.1 relaxase domain-containing protein [Rhodospirillales bacterium]MDE0389108.1 relaxase domain-containing protein [Rhodospirillales bacterium]
MVATVTRLKAAATTVHYFEVDGYYARNDPEHRKASRWHGEAAALLGLHGPVKPNRFESVLAGYVPGTDLRLGRLRDGEHQHRPGVDVTFSAPKSVSLEALVYAAPKTRARVVRAHDEAVQATLGFIETELLQTRSYEPETGRRPRVQADGMVAATFRHLASRNLDPQLHTHAVIANMTRGRDGDWRSAEFTSVERSKLLIGAYYRNELQTRLEGIGYATVPTLVGRMPGFEIAGYQRPMLEAFSTRRRELLDYMADRGWENTPARTQQAALYTRRRKAEPDRQVLHETWQERAQELGPARDRDTARGRNGARAASPQRELRAYPTALSVVRRAVEHLEERRTVFSANDLRAWALAHGGGRHSLEALDAAIAQLRRDGHLIEVTARRADLAFVTDRARNAERDIIAGMRAGLDAGRSLAPEAAVEAGLGEAGLNPGQRDAARAILLSPHRTVGVQGHAGSGKTTMLRAVKELAGENRIVGLAPSASAVHVMAGEADIPARTLQGFLTRYRDVGDGIAPPEKTEEARNALGGTVLILDEASMVGTVQMRALTQIAAQTDVARLALIGDRRQLRSVEAGQPFGLLQDAGMPTARMDEVVRQRDADLRQAVLHMVADEPRMAVEELGNGVLETESGELGRKAAQLWFDLDPSLRDGTAILAPTHELRAEINEAVRQGLEDEGVLHGPALEIERYVNLHLTRSQKGEVANYRPGDVAVFHHDVYGVKAKAGDACRVLETQDGGRVRLAHPDGRERRIDPAGYIRYRLDLYETRPMVLRAGDRVRWTRNDASRSLINGEHAELLSIGPVNVRMRTQDGREIAMARDDPQLHHLDHAYSSTVHAAQGLTCDRVIAVLDTDHGPVDQAMFYVELTRARDNVVLLTDDREALIEALETAPAEELSALRAVGEQFESPNPTVAQHSPPERAPVLDNATRERRREAVRFVDRTLSAAAASIRERDERAREAHSHDAHVTQAPGYAEWREGARRALADFRKILDDPETFGRHLARRPGAADEMKRLSAQIASDLKEDSAEIDRRQKRQEQQKLERQKQEQQERKRRKTKTRDRGGLSM